MSSSPSAPKINSLESLRGLAALSVVFAHFIFGFAPDMGAPFGWTADALVTNVASYPLRSARYMVSIFFVLSGFVLARSYLLSGRPEALTSAAVRRYPRLVIPCLAAILVAHVLYANGFMYNHPAYASLKAEYSLQGWSWLDALYGAPPSLKYAFKEGTWAMFFGYDHGLSYNVNLWTMAHEFLGSFVVFGCLGVFGRGRSLLAACAVLTAVCLLNGWIHVGLFVVGMFLSEAFRLTRVRLPLAVAVALAGVSLWFGGHHAQGVKTMPLTGFRYDHNLLYRDAAAVLAVIVSAFSPAFDRLLALRPFVFLGKISFGMYLIHVPIIASLCSWQYLTHRAAGWTFNQAMTGVVLAYVPAVLAASTLLYYFADRPAIWFSRVVYDVGFRPAVAADPAAAPVRRPLLARLLGRRDQPTG